ncbi:MAG: hypothetical protein EZS28_025582 [Streblomastix strix]|uniref:Uncharacterized protein n=1 Tax=Streblomastix strix TaxID=222440 RepID=A0A5J4V8U3_9EUKA|nr:MAG: hypothetical protein EZS28_025582 [Streblomastix strix]
MPPPRLPIAYESQYAPLLLLQKYALLFIVNKSCLYNLISWMLMSKANRPSLIIANPRQLYCESKESAAAHINRIRNRESAQLTLSNHRHWSSQTRITQKAYPSWIFLISIISTINAHHIGRFERFASLTSLIVAVSSFINSVQSKFEVYCRNIEGTTGDQVEKDCEEEILEEGIVVIVCIQVRLTSW